MTDYDAVLLVSFGGPEGPQDVVPFLENVTRGRGIPRDRLEQVGAHYALFGGVSPINAQNRALLTALRAELADAGVDLPVYWGNRNWDPYLADALREMRDAGVRRALAFVTSAYSSYSGCRQYRENLAAARAEVDGAPEVDKVRHYFDHPGFVEPFVDATLSALASLPDAVQPGARLVFTTHSIPVAAADSSGPDGGAYVAQHRAVAELVAGRVAEVTGVARPWDLVFQSRSGPPTQAWLEPDISDHLETLAADGASGVVVVPIGFVSDHMEVIYDLDTQARETCDQEGIAMVRAATAGVLPGFVRGLVDRVLAAGRRDAPVPDDGCGGVCASPCGAEVCCPNLRRPGTPAVG